MKFFSALRLWQPTGYLLLIFSVLCLPLLFSSRETNYKWDEANYHLPAIRQIRSHWPALDVKADSLSATAPGYQYILASLSYLSGTGTLSLRLLNFGVSCGVLLLLASAWSAHGHREMALAALLPLAASNFFVKSGAYVVTDNAALLATAAALLAMFSHPRPWGAGLGCAATTLSIFIRQSGAWLLAPLLVRILSEPGGLRPNRRWLLLLPPVGLLLWLVWRWGGLVPPGWQHFVTPSSGLAFSSMAYSLAVLGLLGPWYYLAARPAGPADPKGYIWPVVGLVVGVVAALSGPTVSDHQAGRWGGYLWNLSTHLPVFGSHSLLFLLLSPFGGLTLGLLLKKLWQTADRTSCLLWLASYLAWFASGLSNRQIFHRYFEPTLLVLLSCWLLLLLRTRAPLSIHRYPLFALGLAQGGITLLTAYATVFGLP